MNFEIHTLYWKNSNPVFYDYHSKIMKKFKVDINYTNENINHGIWMDNIMKESKSDIIGFIDIDCVVTNDQIISECIEYLNKQVLLYKNKAKDSIKKSQCGDFIYFDPPTSRAQKNI